MQCLLGLLNDGPVDLPQDGADFGQAFALAEEEQLLPWVAHICASRVSDASELFLQLKTIERDSTIAAFYWTSELTGILHAFEEHGIVIVPLKGPFMAERLYGKASLRVSHDLDLLVSKQYLICSERVLSELGFTPDTPDDYHRQWSRGHTSVELHHDVVNPLAFDFDVERALQRVQPGTFQGQRCWQLAPLDELVFLCLHGVRHRFERMSLVLDLCLAFQKLDLSTPGAAAPNVEEYGSLLALGLAMARCLRPETTEPPFPVASPAQRRHSEALAEKLWHRLMTQPSQTLDWRALHAFYLEIELPRNRPRRRWRHTQILLGRAIKPDYEFAARFGYSRPWQVRLLRPLRLIRDAIRRGSSE